MRIWPRAQLCRREPLGPTRVWLRCPRDGEILRDNLGHMIGLTRMSKAKGLCWPCPLKAPAEDSARAAQWRSLQRQHRGRPAGLQPASPVGFVPLSFAAQPVASFPFRTCSLVIWPFVVFTSGCCCSFSRCSLGFLSFLHLEILRPEPGIVFVRVWLISHCRVWRP